MSSKKDIVQDAIEFAKTVHYGQRRKNGEDFIKHPLRVKEFLEQIRIKDKNILTAAVLHAVVSNGGITYEELQKEFGNDTTFLVKSLTEIGKIQIPSAKTSKRIANLHKLLLHLSKDMRVLLIRLADRVDNIKTSTCFSTSTQNWIASKALNIYAPVAKSAGVYTFTRELENEALRILNPQRYEQIKSFLNVEYKESENYLALAKSKLEKELIKYNEKYNISFRKKGIYSVHRKALSKVSSGEIKNTSDLRGIFDLLGIRVLLEKEESCYKLLAFIQENWKVIQNEYDDYIVNPKPNGYKSLQTAVWINPKHACEIQIRTFEMHEFNEYGPASHYSYKYAHSNKQPTTWIKRLISLKENIQKEIAGDNKIKLFEDTIFVFTPANDVIALPKDSTPIDFAYAIHSEIGNHCSRAKVNGKLTKLDTKLESGQSIEIVTNKHKKPSVDWLRIVKTTEAKRQIKKNLESTT